MEGSFIAAEEEEKEQEQSVSTSQLKLVYILYGDIMNGSNYLIMYCIVINLSLPPYM